MTSSLSSGAVVLGFSAATFVTAAVLVPVSLTALLGLAALVFLVPGVLFFGFFPSALLLSLGFSRLVLYLSVGILVLIGLFAAAASLIVLPAVVPLILIAAPAVIFSGRVSS